MKILLAIMLMAGFVQARTIELTPQNTVTLRNEVNDYSITKLQVELASAVARRGVQPYTIYIVLDSPGGSIDSGLNFIEFAKTFKNVETITLFAASMGSAIVEGLPGRRNITETGILMFHRASGGVQGQFENGELESRLNAYKRIVRSMEQINADRLKISLESYKAKVKDELWIIGKEAITQRAADEIVSVSCSSSLIAASTIETFTIMGMFTIDAKFSACPLIKGGTVIDSKNRDRFNEYRASKWNIGNSR